MRICCKPFAPLLLGRSKPMVRPASPVSPVPFRHKSNEHTMAALASFGDYPCAVLSNKFAELACPLAEKSC
jgi:hypothetical protein